MPEDFKVRVGEVEGPLELILDMIEKRKLHISDISLSQVADEFIEHVKSFEDFPMADSAPSPTLVGPGDQKNIVSDLADFILVASTLLLIKSKSLLPNLPLTQEEEGSIEDLENRLKSYKKYKELSLSLGQMFGSFLYFPNERKQPAAIFYPTRDISLGSLKGALLEALRNMPQAAAELPKVTVDKTVSLEEMVDRLTQRVKASLKMSFKEFSSSGSQESGRQERVNVIVSFLAMLELVKQGAIRASQEKHFADIEIESEEAGVPAYF